MNTKAIPKKVKATILTITSLVLRILFICAINNLKKFILILLSLLTYIQG